MGLCHYLQNGNKFLNKTDPLYFSAIKNSNDMFKDLLKIFKETTESFTLSKNLGQYPTNEIYEDVSIIYILTIAWNIKEFNVVVMFSVACETFYSRLDDIKSVFRRTTKNICRLCDIRSSKIRVCGLFAVDAALPLRLLDANTSESETIGNGELVRGNLPHCFVLPDIPGSWTAFVLDITIFTAQPVISCAMSYPALVVLRSVVRLRNCKAANKA
ncbi:hypothetical protein EVAR_44979_1 [Eumeta japonica]|uniref:Uncharacterized protein n=1 Tax=Eumeta variegata TaxID=151549 RepID=A0A4C1XFG6_EUMVA|nr:hypothetical protein EVAR_44979_1 [Eumeta japonica]